jgi:DNA polymerase
LIGEAPGRNEDRTGQPFVGAAGRVLDRALAEAGLARADVYITNVVKCRPPANRAPKADEVEACRPYLMSELGAVQPKLLVTLGAHALRGLVGPRPRFADARGTPIEFEGVRLLPTYHPAAILYNRRLESALAGDLRKVAELVREARVPVPSAGRLSAGSRGPSRATTRSGRRRR